MTASAPERQPSLPYALALALSKAALGVAVLSTGFHGISDDDFARVVIAERFADSPTLDPSGTSWLPLPFWIYGAALHAFGSTLFVARMTALALGIAAILVLFEAGRALRLGTRAAFAGAAVAAVFPYSAYLGVATVPEAPTAALMVFGAATLSGRPKQRWLGALALALATAARYEAWSAAMAFAALCAWQAWRARDARVFAPALLALGFPVIWLLHGVIHHDDALFFVARVTAYRSALGLEPALLGAALTRTPLAIVTGEPELVLALVTALAACRLLVAPEGGEHERPRLGRFFIVLLAILVMLMLGDARGSAPTHHGERALLSLWFGAALVLGAIIERALETPGRVRWTVPGAVLGTVFVAAVLIRPAFPRDPFAERRSELAVGESARRRSVDHLVIDAPDFGFFAVQAAFGAPGHTQIVDDHDPRKPRQRDLLTSDPIAFLDRMRRQGLHWLALPTARVAALGTAASVRDTHDRFALVEFQNNLPIESPTAGSAPAGPARAGAGPAEVSH